MIRLQVIKHSEGYNRKNLIKSSKEKKNYG